MDILSKQVINHRRLMSEMSIIMLPGFNMDLCNTVISEVNFEN